MSKSGQRPAWSQSRQQSQRPRPVRVLFGHQQGPGASRIGRADQCAIDVADHIPVSAFRVGLGVSDAARRAIS